MTPLPPRTLRLKDLPNNSATAFSVIATQTECGEMSVSLGLNEMRKLRFEGKLSPDGDKDWHLDGRLGATVVQSCVVTGDPVVTRIEEPVVRRFVSEMPEPPEGDEVEMPEDDTVEELPEVVDLMQIAYEVVSLALPAFPRTDGAELDQTTFGPPGVDPLTDAGARPFASLASLKDRMTGGDDN